MSEEEVQVMQEVGFDREAWSQQLQEEHVQTTRKFVVEKCTNLSKYPSCLLSFIDIICPKKIYCFLPINNSLTITILIEKHIAKLQELLAKAKKVEQTTEREWTNAGKVHESNISLFSYNLYIFRPPQ